jgi:hypothetical protein
MRAAKGHGRYSPKTCGERYSWSEGLPSVVQCGLACIFAKATSTTSLALVCASFRLLLYLAWTQNFKISSLRAHAPLPCRCLLRPLVPVQPSVSVSGWSPLPVLSGGRDNPPPTGCGLHEMVQPFWSPRTMGCCVVRGIFASSSHVLWGLPRLGPSRSCRARRAWALEQSIGHPCHLVGGALE